MLDLEGKHILVLGADRGSRSIDTLRIGRDATGATLHVACFPGNFDALSRLLEEENDYTREGIKLVPVPGMIMRKADEQEVKSNLMEIMKDVPLSGCVTFQDSWVQLAAELCEAWNLPGCDPEGVTATINKHTFRQKVKEAGLSIAECCTLQEFGDSKMSLPVIIKPAEGVGSHGVYLVENEDDLVEKYTTYEREHPEKYKLWIAEEFLDGPELGVELVMSDGECIFSSLMECTKTPPPVFQGLGRFYPSRALNPQQQEDTIKECIAVAKLLRLHHGVLDLDVKYTSIRGPVVLEINCRMGGFSVALMHDVVYGMRLVEQHLKCSCGINHSEAKYEPKAKYVFAKLILSEIDGVFESMNTDDALFRAITSEMPDDKKEYLRCARLVTLPGTHVVGNDHGKIPTIMAIVIATSDKSHEEAE